MRHPEITKCPDGTEPNLNGRDAGWLPLSEAVKRFGRPDLLSAGAEANRRPEWKTVTVYNWITNEDCRTTRPDDRAVAARRLASYNLEQDFISRLVSGELEADALPQPLGNGSRVPIPAACWAALKIDWSGRSAWDGPGKRFAPGDTIYRDLRIRRRLSPSAVDEPVDPAGTASDSPRGKRPTRILPPQKKIEAWLQSTHKQFQKPPSEETVWEMTLKDFPENRPARRQIRQAWEKLGLEHARGGRPPKNLPK